MACKVNNCFSALNIFEWYLTEHTEASDFTFLHLTFLPPEIRNSALCLGETKVKNKVDSVLE